MGKVAKDVVSEFLDTVIEAVGVDAEVSINEDDGAINVSIEGEDLGLLIGFHGKTLDAIQHLAFQIARMNAEESPASLQIDVAGYRERRAEAVCERADEAMEALLDGESEIALEPMSAYERRIVHEYIRERGGFETDSEGEGQERHIVVRSV